MRGRHHIRDALSLNLTTPPARQVGRQVRHVPALQVPELVDQRLNRLGVIHGAADPDRAAGRVGPAVGPAGVTAVHRVAVPKHLTFQSVPQPGRGLTYQQARGDLGQRRPLGLV